MIMVAMLAFVTIAAAASIVNIYDGLRFLGTTTSDASGSATPEQRLAVRREKSKPHLIDLETWMRQQRTLLSSGNDTAKAINYLLNRWAAFTRFLDDGRVCLSNNAAERALRGVAMHESLCTPSSSVCKHWNRIGVDNATRATFPGHRRFDRLRRQVVRTDLMRCAGNDLHSRKHTGFDKATYRVVCDA